MIGQNTSQPALFQMVDLGALIPEGHRLRQLDAVLDLSFVHQALAPFYTPGLGRPSVDPELALRMMILGVAYNLSDRQLCDEVRMHAGFRWFCRLNFHDSVPNHSTLSRLRNERWAGSDLFAQLFDEVLGSCVSKGMVSGRHVSVDGTQIRADASMKSLERDERSGPESTDTAASTEPPEAGTPAEPAPEPTLLQVKASPAKEPQPKDDWEGHGERYSNQTHTSTTDPEARLYRKGAGKSASLSFLVHDVIDTKSRVILGRRASLATGTAEREVALALVAEHEERRIGLGLEQPIEVLTGDTGYGAGDFVAALVDRGITPHVPLLASPEMEAVPVYKRRTFNLARHQKRLTRVRQIQARNLVRMVAEGHGYAVSRKLRNRSEHIFAEAKNRHGLGRARHRSLEKVDRHSLLVATVQNLKRLAESTKRAAQAAAAALGSFLVPWKAIWLALRTWDARRLLNPHEPRYAAVTAGGPPGGRLAFNRWRFSTHF